MSLYKPEKISFTNWKEAEPVMQHNWDQLEQIDLEAKERGELLWRYIQEPFADGYAIYQIVKVNKTTVRIQHCAGFGDDWVIPYWGAEATIDLDYAITKTQQRDNISELFGSKET